MTYQQIGLFSTDHVPVLRRYPLVFWVACFVIFAIVTTILSTEQPPSQRFRFLMFCGVLELAGLLLVPSGLHLCRRAFLDWAQSAEGFIKVAKHNHLINWYNTELTFFSGSKPMVVASLAFAAIATISYAAGGFRQDVTLAGWIWMESVVYVSAFMAGCGLWIMCCGAIAIWRLGARFTDSITVTTGRFGVLSTGRVLAWCWAIIGGVWFVYTLSALFGPEHLEISTFLRSYPVLMLAVPTLPLIFGSFIGCQIPMHRGMVAYKKREIRRVGQRLEKMLSDKISTPNKKRREEIEFMRRRMSELERLPEWPFGAWSLARVGGSTITAVLPVVLKAAEFADLLGGSTPKIK